MRRISFALFLALGSFTSQAFAAPANKPPVANQVADFTVYANGLRSIDLLSAFSDPDATAAVRMTTKAGNGTVFGNIDVVLFGNDAPNTVANFLQYVDSGYYMGTNYTPSLKPGAFVVGDLFHRSENDKINNVPVKAIWGGLVVAITNDGTNVTDALVAQQNVIKNEFKISNTTGTIGMWKSNGPDSATSEWFINLTDNGGAPLNLDSLNGGYTVFGRMVGNSINVANTINNAPRWNLGFPFDPQPLVDYNGTGDPKVQNLIFSSAITRIPPMTFTATSNNPAVADVSLNGTFLHVNAKQLGTATISITATDLDGAQASQSFKVTVVTAPGRLVNISTRLQVGTDQNVLIGGFIARGSAPKRLLIRGIGPSLSSQNVANPLADPVLELHDNTGAVIATNDNWQTNANASEISDTGIAPSSASEAAILTTVPTNSNGIGYTVVLSGANSGTGVGLVEVYDLDSGPGSTVLNISTRGKVDTGENVMIGGFFIGGTDSKTVLVRGIGPSLSSSGVSNALADPQLELHNANGTTIDTNDDWQTSAHKTEIQNSGIAPSNPKEAAMYDTLAPGAYTAILRGGGATPTGVALVEVYQL